MKPYLLPLKYRRGAASFPSKPILGIVMIYGDLSTKFGAPNPFLILSNMIKPQGEVLQKYQAHVKALSSANMHLRASIHIASFNFSSVKRRDASFITFMKQYIAGSSLQLQETWHTSAGAVHANLLQNPWMIWIHMVWPSNRNILSASIYFCISELRDSSNTRAVSGSSESFQ